MTEFTIITITAGITITLLALICMLPVLLAMWCDHQQTLKQLERDYYNDEITETD